MPPAGRGATAGTCCGSALRHLPEVFIVTPQGSLLAPNAVELRMNPADIESLAELIDLNLVNASAAEAYAAEVAAHAARVVSNVPLEVGVVADVAVPPGRYRLRQRSSLAAMTLDADPVTSADPLFSAYPAGAPGPASMAGPAGAHGPVSAPGPVRAPSLAEGAYPVWRGHRPLPRRPDQVRTGGGPAFMTGAATVDRAQVPRPDSMLRLITNGAVAETRVSGARAGRGKAVELPLPEEPTVSRVHATFTCTGGEWRITVLGRNGVLLNAPP